MRVTVGVVVVVAMVAALIAFGVGQGGPEGCVNECQRLHCAAAGTELMDCAGEEFRDCAKACRDAAQ